MRFFTYSQGKNEKELTDNMRLKVAC